MPSAVAQPHGGLGLRHKAQPRQRGDRPDLSLEKEIQAHRLLSARSPGTALRARRRHAYRRTGTRKAPAASRSRREAGTLAAPPLSVRPGTISGRQTDRGWGPQPRHTLGREEPNPPAQRVLPTAPPAFTEHPARTQPWQCRPSAACTHCCCKAGRRTGPAPLQTDLFVG